MSISIIEKYKKDFEQLKNQNLKQKQEIEKILNNVEQLSVHDNVDNNVVVDNNFVVDNNTFGSKDTKDTKDTKNLSSSSPYPLSIQLESETLQKFQKKLPFRKYLDIGYKNYRTWLTMTLGSMYENHLNFCLARNMNVFKPYIMGIDLEIRYLIKRLEGIFGLEQMKYYEHVIEKTLCENLSISPAHAQSIIDTYLKNPKNYELTLSNDDFNQRLKKIDTTDLDFHSFNCWRNSNHVKLNQTPYPVSRSDILNGESLAPPSSKHIGIQMLQLHGFVPVITNIRKPQKYGTTFI